MEQRTNLEGSKGENKDNSNEISDQNMENEQRNKEGEIEENKEVSKATETIKVDADHKKTIKNLISVVILLSGIAVGSFFVDIAQFVGGSGYSERAVNESGIFVAGDKTWIAFDDPAVEVEVLTLDDSELEDCPNCDPTEVIDWLKRFMPTLVAKKVVASTPEGEALIEKHNLKAVPAFVFSSEVADSEFYQGEANVLFDQKDDKYVLNTIGLGVPVGKYLETPGVSDDDPKKGSEDAKVKVVVFSDFQCPYCKQFHDELVSLVDDEFEDDVLLVYKDMPLEFHPRALDAAMAARCAQNQGKFWEMGEVLYENQEEWGSGIGADEFRRYAASIGLNTQEFAMCLDAEEYQDEIESNLEEGREFGVSGVPATFINDQFVSGVVSQEELRSIIQEELEK